MIILLKKTINNITRSFRLNKKFPNKVIYCSSNKKVTNQIIFKNDQTKKNNHPLKKTLKKILKNFYSNKKIQNQQIFDNNNQTKKNNQLLKILKISFKKKKKNFQKIFIQIINLKPN